MRTIRTLIALAAMSIPFAVGCATAPGTEPEDQSTAVSPLEEGAAPAQVEPDIVCRPPVNGRCQNGCCLLINRTTTPPTETCNDCI